MKPLISIVCGTYNRLNSLKEMLASIEVTIPSTIPYEVVVIDNASTDGTWQWLTEQSDRFDMQLIDMGKPVGAIKAFTEGAYKALGKYVLLATDDILFPEYAIVTALSHIEDNPKCGAVAFAHNKRRDKFIIDKHPVRDLNDNVISYPYPQISLVRKSVGDACGWWGGRDAMKEAFTYGGDNYLGAQIIEHGFSVDTVDGAKNIERVFDDEPRKMNSNRHKADANLFRQAFPRHPKLKVVPTIPLENAHMRIMYVNAFTPNDTVQKRNKRGLREALERVGVVWEVDYRAYGKKAPELLCKVAKALQPHLILMQVHKTDVIDGVVIRAMRNEAPHTVIINRIGDVYGDLHLQGKQLQTWQQCDALLVVNASTIENLRKAGVNAFYWAHSYESVDEPLPDMPTHDVVFLGNGYDEFRKQLAQNLRDTPHDVGIYGKGHIVETNGVTHYDFAKGRALYGNAKIAISDQHFRAYAYTSNRFWEIMAGNGALILHQKTDGFDAMTGLREGVHYVTWLDFDDLKNKIAYWLADENQRRRKQIVRNAKRQADYKHSFDSRVKQLLTEIIPELAKACSRDVA